MEEKGVCGSCGMAFTKNRPWQLYCNKRCSQKEKDRRRGRAWAQRLEDYQKRQGPKA